MNDLKPKPNRRILIIDDNRAIHDDFLKILKSESSDQGAMDQAEAALFGEEAVASQTPGFEIDSAYQGKEGMEMVQKALAEGRPYAMAFVDVRMPPGWDGIETTSKIWEVYPDLQIVICTAYSDYSWDDMIAKVGQSDRLVILKKPFDNVEVLQLANALTAKWQLLQQAKSKIGDLELMVAARTKELESSLAQLQSEMIQRKRLEEWQEMEIDVLEFLAGNGSFTESLTLIARSLETLSPGVLCTVLLVDREVAHLRCVAGPSLPASYTDALSAVPIGPQSGSCGTAAFTRKLVVVTDIANDPLWIDRRALALKHDLRACWSTPILTAQGQLLGTFALYYRETREPSLWELELVRRATSLAGIAIERELAAAGHQEMEVQLRHAQKMESIGQLAAGIAHEINTPTQYIGDNTRFVQDAFRDLSQLLGVNTRLLAAAKLGAVKPELIAEVEAAAKTADLDYLSVEIPKAIEESLQGVGRVSKIVRAMKEFSHPGTSEKTPMDLNQAIESTLTVARNEWKYVAEMVMEFDAELPKVPCLPGEFNQVILNLVVNASHAIGDTLKERNISKGLITITTKRDGNWAEIRLRDSGTGIPEHARGKIFDPFFTTKGVGKGTGQGLAIARSVIVDKHGGTITFETEIGKGTTFIIRLPLVASGKLEKKL